MDGVALDFRLQAVRRIGNGFGSDVDREGQIAVRVLLSRHLSAKMDGSVYVDGVCVRRAAPLAVYHVCFELGGDSRGAFSVPRRMDVGRSSRRRTHRRRRLNAFPEVREFLFGCQRAPQVEHVGFGVAGSPIGVELIAEQVGGNVQEAD